LWQKQALSDGLRVNGGRFGQDVSVGSTSASAALTKASPTASRSIAAASANTSPTASGFVAAASAWLDAMTEIESGKATVLDLSIYSNGPGVLT
jgi:hypothetical protein